MKEILEKILVWLRVRSVAAGLEVSDEVVRLVVFDGKAWQLNAVRLTPGTLERGKILNHAAFVAALAALKAKIAARQKNMNVVLCPTSTPVYVQSLNLPSAKGEDFTQAIELNLAIASPLEADKSYYGWQYLGRNEATLQDQVVAAFIERQPVNEMVDAMLEAGFLAVAVEPEAVALARAFRDKGNGIDASKPYLFINVGSAGIGFLVIRSGQLHFQYSEPWRDIADQKGEINVETFKNALTAGVRQVSNFYRQHWSEPLGAIIVSSSVLAKDAETAIATAIPDTPVVALALEIGQSISPEWLAALGASLRTGKRGAAIEINLLGIESQDRYHEEQFSAFLRFWRVALPVALLLLLVGFWATDNFLRTTKLEIETRSDFNVGSTQAGEIQDLEKQSAAFNQMVGLVFAAEHMTDPKSTMLDVVARAAVANNINISHLTFASFGSPISLAGSTNKQDNIVNFKATLASDTAITAVNLPLTGVQTLGGVVSFAMTFIYTPANVSTNTAP